MVGRGHMASAGVQAYNGHLGAPPEAESLSIWASKGDGKFAKRWQICQLICILLFFLTMIIYTVLSQYMLSSCDVCPCVGPSVCPSQGAIGVKDDIVAEK